MATVIIMNSSNKLLYMVHLFCSEAVPKMHCIYFNTFGHHKTLEVDTTVIVIFGQSFDEV